MRVRPSEVFEAYRRTPIWMQHGPHKDCSWDILQCTMELTADSERRNKRQLRRDTRRQIRKIKDENGNLKYSLWESWVLSWLIARVVDFVFDWITKKESRQQ